MQPNPNAGKISSYRSPEEWQAQAQSTRDTWQQNAPAPTPAPSRQSPLTQAYVTGAQAAAAARPQPPAPPRVDINAVVKEQPPVMFTKGDRPFTAQSGLPPKPAPQPRGTGDAAGNFVVEPEGLIANLPKAAALSPQQQRSRDIINNPTQTGTVVQPFTEAQKAEGRANTLRGMGVTDVTRVGNSFSGPANISGNITINGKTPGGGFMVADPAGRAADAMMAARYDARMAEPTNQNATVMSGRTYGVLGEPSSASDRRFEQRSGEGGRQYIARMNAMQADAASLRSDATTRRGQDLTQETDLRRDGTTRRGQDMDLQGRLMPKQMEIQMAQAQRQRMVDTLRGATPVGKDGKPTGGINYLAAMESALANGDAATAKSISEFVEAQQKLTSGTNKISGENMNRFKRFGTLRGEDGKLDEVANQDLMNSILSQRPELMTAPDSVLNRDMPAIVAEQSVLQKINKARAEQGGFTLADEWTPFTPNFLPPTTGDFSGRVPDSFFKQFSTTDQAGFLGGGWGSSAGDSFLGTGGLWNNKYNLGNLNADERAYIARRIKEANKTK